MSKKKKEAEVTVPEVKEIELPHALAKKLGEMAYNDEYGTLVEGWKLIHREDEGRSRGYNIHATFQKVSEPKTQAWFATFEVYAEEVYAYEPHKFYKRVKKVVRKEEWDHA